MGNTSIKIAITKIPGVAVMPVGDKKTECVVIPIEYCNLFKGEKDVYIDFTAIPLSSPKTGSKDTHLVKQSFGKDKFASMSEDEKKNVPILGNMIDWDKANGSTENKPTSASNNTSKPTWL